MPLWQIGAVSGFLFIAIILIPRLGFAIRLAKAVWLERIPDNLLFPPGVVTPSGITAQVRPIRKYLLAFRIALFGLFLLAYAALGCPGQIGFGLTPAEFGPWLTGFSLIFALFASSGVAFLHQALATIVTDHLGGIRALRRATRR
jgi:hypothetical protein